MAAGEDFMILLCHYNSSDSYPEDQVTLRLCFIFPVIIFGLIGNMVNITVFSHQRMRKSTTNWYLLTLAVSDSVLLLSTFSMLVLPVLTEKADTYEGHLAAQYLMRWFFPISQLAITVSVYTVLTVTFHRYLGICHPFFAQRYCTPHYIKASIFGTLIFATVFSSPRWACIQLVECFSPGFNRSGFLIAKRPLYNHWAYSLLYSVFGYIIIMFLVPFAFLCILNSQLIRAVKNSSKMQKHGGFLSSHDRFRKVDFGKERQSSDVDSAAGLEHNNDRKNNNGVGGDMIRKISSCKLSLSTRMNTESTTTITSGSASNRPGRKENNITLMLISIVTLFLISNTLPFSNNILERFFTILTDQQAKYFRILVESGNLLVTLNASVYIIIYYTFNRRYRSVLQNVIGCCFCGGLRRRQSGNQDWPTIHKTSSSITMPNAAMSGRNYSQAKIQFNFMEL